MGLTPSQALTSVRDQYAESGSGFFTDAEIRSYLWDGERQINALLECNQVTTSIVSTATVQEYARQGLINIHHVTYDGDKLKKIVFRDLYASDDKGTTTDSQTGDPVAYYEWGSNISLWPIPSASSAAIKIWGIDDCTQVVSGATAFTIDGSLTNGLPYYALSIMSAKDHDDGKTAFYTAKWTESKEETNRIWNRRKNSDMISVVKDEYDYPTSYWGMR
jgi:hypothetical protein